MHKAQWGAARTAVAGITAPYQRLAMVMEGRVLVGYMSRGVGPNMWRSSVAMKLGLARVRGYALLGGRSLAAGATQGKGKDKHVSA